MRLVFVFFCPFLLFFFLQYSSYHDIVQLVDWNMSLGGRDLKVQQKVKRVEERKMKEESRKRKYVETKRKEEESQQDAYAEPEAMFPEDSSMAEKESSDSSYTPPESHRQIEIPPLNMPRNVLMLKDVADGPTD